jgi:Uma2 family endonuclease
MTIFVKKTIVMGESLEKKSCTVEEYFALEETSEIRHEYFDGEIFAMAGGTLNHNRLTRKVANLIERQAKNHCAVFTENVKLEAIKDFYYPYPDVVLTCNPFDLRQKNKISHPSLIVEVLSTSTEKYDKTTKLKKYKAIASVHYYMLVSQYEMSVELYSRVSNALWTYEEFTEQNATINLEKLDITLSLSDFYENIVFENEEILE